jgi:polyisoprenoid-binding protein YceI
MKLRNLVLIVVLLAVIGGGAYLGYLYYVGSNTNFTDIDEAASTLEVENENEGTVFSIVGAESQVSFTLEEDLRGARTTVIATTNEVAGDIFINFANPQASEIGTITVNARSLATDNNLRNGQIRNNILRSSQDEYEFITFTPTAVNGLPETVSIGESYNVEIVGALTIIETTNEVTFPATITIESESRISGTASAVITYADWGIPVPTAPGVANVTPETTLAINFVAVVAAGE